MKLPELQHLEDPQNQLHERATHPLAMALRNAGVALLGIALTGGVYWLKLQSQGNVRQPYWWISGAVAGFVVVVCFTHAALAARFGAHRANTFMKIVAVIALVGMLLGLRWYVQPKGGA